MPEQAKTTKAATLLADNVAKLMNSATYKEALKFRSKFYRYSFNNCFLIQVQCPEASYVAGYRRWQELGRQVKKGEKAISILAPIIKKVEENGKEEKRLVGFRSANVFDVQQTKPIDPEQGDELPELPKPERLSGDSESIRATIKRLETYATEQGFPVQRKAIPGSALGKFSLTTKAITLRDDLEPLQELKTLTHELAHALMHRDIHPQSEKRHLCELEAESCAFILCHALNLDTSRYSFPYLLNWVDDPSELLPAAEKASRVADSILETLRGLFFWQSPAFSGYCAWLDRRPSIKQIRISLSKTSQTGIEQ